MQELEHGNGTISNTMLSSGLEMRLKMLHGVMDRTDCRKLEECYSLSIPPPSHQKRGRTELIAGSLKNAMPSSPFLLPPIKREVGLN